jgi:guanylate kinase
MENFRDPILFCFIGPGASGKSTICTALSERELPVTLSVSSTTRTPRVYEKEGREYYFITREEFLRREEERSFLEHAQFAGNFYGTEKRNIERAGQLKKHLLLDIEIQGVRQLKTLFPAQVVVIFVCPPSLQDLKDRFILRGADTEERMQERLLIAKEEISIAMEGTFSDYVIINSSLDKSIKAAEAIVVAESVRRRRVDEQLLTTFGIP